jgi:hypothetical protein
MIGNIKSQGQLDGKFRASTASTSLEYLRFLISSIYGGMMRAALFGRNPESQTERDQRHRADAAEPEGCEPQ